MVPNILLNITTTITMIKI
uniref:Uncharacterized protein n=1 Tax=Romanomermis culicivorax TaxID=13658 RepID=A0A915HXG0_ROMCU